MPEPPTMTAEERDALIAEWKGKGKPTEKKTGPGGSLSSPNAEPEDFHAAVKAGRTVARMTIVGDGPTRTETMDDAAFQAYAARATQMVITKGAFYLPDERDTDEPNTEGEP